MIADITIFDPQTVAEGSDYKTGMNGLPPKGLPHVIVNGQVIIEDGVADTNLRAGKPIRYPVIKEGEIDLDLGDKPFQWHADLEEGDFAPSNAVEPERDVPADTRSKQIQKSAKTSGAQNPMTEDGRPAAFTRCLNLCCVAGMSYPLNHPKLRPFADQLAHRQFLVSSATAGHADKSSSGTERCQRSLVASDDDRARQLGYCCQWHMVAERFESQRARFGNYGDQASR